MLKSVAKGNTGIFFLKGLIPMEAKKYTVNCNPS